MALSSPDDAAEADVAGGGVDRLGVARGRAVAAAVARRAQVRAALDDLARNADCRLAGVVAVLLAPATRVCRDAAVFQRSGLVLRRIPVGRPLPDVADHVVEPVGV